MDLAKVPIVPRWNLPSGCVCTPDGGFLYVGAKSINFIGDVRTGRPIVKVFRTFQNIVGVDVDPDWGEKKPKYFVVLAQDNSVQIWDFEKSCAVRGHKVHTLQNKMEGNEPSPHHGGDPVLISYMRNHNVLSLGEQGLVKYCVISNSYVQVPLFVPTGNQRMTALRCSPFNEQIFALGTSRGLVMLCDLQRMCTLYTLRGHHHSITSLSWIRTATTPVQDVSKSSPETKTDKLTASETTASCLIQNNATASNGNALSAPSGGDDIFDIYNYEYLSNEFGAPCDTDDRESKTVHDFAGLEKPQESETLSKFDFAEACQSLKEDIDARKQEPLSEYDAVTLADCQQAERQEDLSSSCGNEDDEGSASSLQFLDSDSSSNEVDGVRRKPKLQVLLHHAEVHAALNKAPQQSAEVNIANAQPNVDGLDGAHFNQIQNTAVACSSIKQEAEVKTKLGSKIRKEREMLDVNNQKQQTDDNSTGEILLVSAAIDGSYWVWGATSGAACDHMHARGTGKMGKNTNIMVGWQNSSTFLATNKLGELIQYTLQPQPENEISKTRRYKFKEDIRKIPKASVVAFSICRASGLLWCISSNREITCEDLQAGKIIANFSCSSTSVAVIRECPDDMNKIALGFSDRRVGIIDLSKITPTNVSITNFSIHIDAAVMSLVWSQDGKRLAYGTSEGRVGVINVEKSRMQPCTFIPFCGRPIYSMDWQEGRIFVACNEMIAAYDDYALSKDAQIIAGVKGVTTFSVRGKYLFIGTQTGRFNIYRRIETAASKLDYELFHDVELESRYISEIAWSHIAPDQLALVANVNNVHVMKFDEETGLLTPIRKIEVANLKASIGRVKWSNHSKDLLLTCGFDGAVRLWDLTNKSNTEKFLKQFNCPLTCAIFLPTDEQILLCAGKSISLEFVNMRVECSEEYKPFVQSRKDHTLSGMQLAVKAAVQYPPRSLTAAEKRRNRRLGQTPNKNNNHGATVERNSNGNVVDKIEPPLGDDTPIVDMINNLQIDNSQMSGKEGSNIKRKYDDSLYMKNPITLLYMTTKELNKNALDKLKLVLTSSRSENDLPQGNDGLCAKLFGEKAIAEELLAEELSNYQTSETKGIANLLMPQINSKIKDEILKSIESKQLCEWHVSVAPSVSYSFWKKCCIAFADQLLEQGYALQAATYMIAIHNQADAIEILLSKNYFKEALLIARIYMQSDAPVMDKIVDKWICNLESVGNISAAALVCALSGQLERAYKTLSKMRNPPQDVQHILELLKSKIA